MYAILRTTATNVANHQCPQMAAAIAYFMIFSLPGLLLVTTSLVAYVANTGALGADAELRERMVEEIAATAGPISAQQVTDVIERSQKLPTSTWGFISGVLLLLVSASGVVAQVQASLNTIWSVEGESPLVRNRGFVLKRLLSIASVVFLALALLVSLIVTTLLASFGEALAPLLPAGVAASAAWVTSAAANLLVSWLVFTAIYKWLPDVRVGWRDAVRGGILTALLFWIGKSLLAVVIANLGIGSAYGAAGSLAVLLAWLYYSAMVFLVGAELTWAVEDRSRTKRLN